MRSASVVTGDGEQVAHEAGDYGLVSRALGGLPIVNHFLDRLGLPGLLNEALGEVDGCTKLAPASAIRLVITNLVLGREPLYALGEWAARYDPTLLGLSGEEAETIESVVEPFLVRVGMLSRTPRGRVATRRAWEHLGVRRPASGTLFDDDV